MPAAAGAGQRWCSNGIDDPGDDDGESARGQSAPTTSSVSARWTKQRTQSMATGLKSAAATTRFYAEKGPGVVGGPARGPLLPPKALMAKAASEMQPRRSGEKNVEAPSKPSGGRHPPTDGRGATKKEWETGSKQKAAPGEQKEALVRLHKYP